MKKLTIILSFLFLFGCAGMKKKPVDYTKMFEESATATQMFGRDSLTGGTKSVDNITTMVDGDLCIVITDAKVLYFYRYNSSNTDAEGSYIAGVDPIEPDAVGTGAWEMIDSFALGRTSQPGEAFRDSSCTDGDVNFYYYTDCTDTGSGTEDCDVYVQVMKAGVLTTFIFMDADAGVIIKDDAVPDSDQAYSGRVITGFNCGENLAIGDVVYFHASDSDPWHEADATVGSGEFPARGVSVTACTDGNPATIMTKGILRDDSRYNWGTKGGTVYLGEADGTATQTAPSSTGDCIQYIGWAISADVTKFDFTPYYEVSP